MDINGFIEELDSLYTERRINDVEPFFNESIEQAKKENDLAAQFTILNEMMGFFRDTSQFEKSIKACNDCIELMKKMGIEGTVDYATSLQNVANAYRAAGKLAESLEVYKEVFSIYNENIPSDDYRMASLNNNIALLYVHVTFSTVIYSFIMVIYRNAQCNFCVVLPYNVFVEKFFYVVRLRKRFIGLRFVFSDVFKSAAVFNYLETKFNTVITNAYTAGTGNKLTDFILRFTAKRATHGLTFAVIIS